jgi:hypothetical protein
MADPKAIHDFAGVEPAIEFMKRTRWELRDLRKVRVFKDKFQVLDAEYKEFDTGRRYTWAHDRVM